MNAVDGLDDATSPQLEQCIAERTFRSWVQAATDRAVTGPLAIRNVEVDAIPGTPTVLVNGQVFEYRYPFDRSEFSQFVLQAAGDEFSTNPTPSPSPTPTP